MRYVAFGDKQASVLGFGCGSVMGRVARGDSLRAMHQAWDGGVTLFDTARSYGYGEAEGLLGEFLQGKREQAVVVTKFGILPRPQTVWKRKAKPLVRAALRIAPGLRDLVRQGIVGEMSAGHFDVATLRSSLEESLRQLRTDYVDALLLHEPSMSAMAQDDLIAELTKIVCEGKARRAGISAPVDVIARTLSLWTNEFGAVQFPANFVGPIRLEVRHAEGRFVMANHPFGGVTQSKAAINAIGTMRKDPQLDASLREKLQGDSQERVAEIAFAAIFEATKAQAIVTSMLHPQHLHANLAAIDSERFSNDDITTLLRWIRAGSNRQ